MLCDYIIDFSPTAKESTETPLNVFFILCLPSQTPLLSFLLPYCSQTGWYALFPLQYL